MLFVYSGFGGLFHRLFRRGVGIVVGRFRVCGLPDGRLSFLKHRHILFHRGFQFRLRGRLNLLIGDGLSLTALHRRDAVEQLHDLHIPGRGNHQLGPLKVLIDIQRNIPVHEFISEQDGVIVIFNGLADLDHIIDGQIYALLRDHIAQIKGILAAHDVTILLLRLCLGIHAFHGFRFKGIVLVLLPAQHHHAQLLRRGLKIRAFIHNIVRGGRRDVFLSFNGLAVVSQLKPLQFFHRLLDVRRAAISLRPLLIAGVGVEVLGQFADKVSGLVKAGLHMHMLFKTARGYPFQCIRLKFQGIHGNKQYYRRHHGNNAPQNALLFHLLEQFSNTCVVIHLYHPFTGSSHLSFR